MLEGQAGPVDQQDATLTPLDAKMNVTNFDLAQTGFVPSSSGISGSMDFTGKLTSTNGAASSAGTVKLQKLQVVKNGSPSSIPVTIDYAIDYDLRRSWRQRSAYRYSSFQSGGYDLNGALRGRRLC